MGLGAKELEKLDQDFRSGRNPMAYIPLSQALRRQRRFAEALDVCQRGLSTDVRSVAGRIQLARLLADTGRYDDAMQEISKAESFGAIGAMGLLVEKTRCLIKLKRLEEAEVCLRELELRNPLDPQVQVLKNEFRTHRPSTVVHRSQDAVPLRGALVLQMDEIVQGLKKQISSLGKVFAVALLDLDSGKSSVEGSDEIAEIAARFHEEASVACYELDQGLLNYGLIETSKTLVMVVQRQRRLLILGVDPQINFGKLQHRVQLVVRQHLPVEDNE